MRNTIWDTTRKTNVSRMIRLAALTCTAGLALAVAAEAQTKPVSSSDQAGLLSRLQRLEDLDEIRNLLLDYGRFLDARDWRLTPGCLQRMASGWAVSAPCRAGEHSGLHGEEPRHGTPNRTNTYHLLTNFVIDVKGDTATAWSRWTFVTPGADGRPVISQAGRYDDVLVRERAVEIQTPRCGERPAGEVNCVF